MHFKNLVLLFFPSSFALTCVIGIIARNEARILNGDKARLGQFPCTVAIIESYRGFVCGGGIIGDKWILSAAHCATEHEDNDPFKTNNLSVIAGTNDFGRDFDLKSGIQVPIEAIYIPQEYKSATRRADIAVFKLARTLDLKKYHLQQLSVPFGNQNFYEVGIHAVVTGFGAREVKFNGTTKELTDFDIDGKLRYANVRIVDDSEFAKVPHDDFDLGEDHFLAKMMKQSTKPYGMCYGDSGSPMILNHSRILIGVTVEMFDMCDEHEYPSLYTKVGHYLNFIRNAVNDDVTEDIRVKRYQS